MREGAFGDAQFFEGLHLVQQIEGIGFAAEQVLIGADGLGGVLGFVKQLDPETGETCGPEMLIVAGTALGLAVEEGVAAADIGLQAVELADAVAQVDDMGLAGATAVFVGGAAAQERAENAVLHVKHGHVLVERELKPFGGSAVEELENLADVEVVGNGEVVEPGSLYQKFGGDGVGNVEREVADFFEVATIFIVVKCAEVAEEESVGCGFFDEFEVAGFAGFEDSRGCQENLGFGIRNLRSDEGDGVFVAARVFEVAVEVFHAAFEGGGDLLEGAAEDGELGVLNRRAGIFREEVEVGGGDFGSDGLDGGEVFELLDESPAKLVQGGDSDVARALQLVVEGGEFERRITEPAKLGDEGLGGERVFGGFLEEDFAADAAGAALELDGFAGLPGDAEMKGGFFFGRP